MILSALCIGEALYRATSTGDWLHRVPIVILVPTFGLLLVGVVLQLVPRSRIGGVREVVDSIQHDGGVVPIVRLLNVALSALTLGFGGSVGPEGPMVQLGAYIGSWVGQRFRLPRVSLQAIVRAGIPAREARKVTRCLALRSARVSAPPTLPAPIT